MARSQENQRQRTQNNPLLLGSFDTTTLKYLKGSLGPLNQVVGRADTNQQSNGGFGGGTYNHWFQIDLKASAWIIIVKSGPRPNYIQTSVYDLNKNPIEGRGIFQKDSIVTGSNSAPFYPYFNNVMGAQSDLYNTFAPVRLDRGDERYYPLEEGSYLLCVATTRNEIIAYEVGLVIEFPITELFFALENEGDVSLLLLETAIDFSRTVNIVSPVAVDTVINADVDRPNGFTENSNQINSGVTVTILAGSEWLIGTPVSSQQGDEFTVILEPGSDLYYDTIHDHSLQEWENSWESTHQDTDKFPEAFIALTNRM